MAYDLVARSLVGEQCFDRYGKQFCGRSVAIFSNPNNTPDMQMPQMFSSLRGDGPATGRVLKLPSEHVGRAVASVTLVL